MKRFSFSSLRVRLILLVILAITPSLGLTLYTASEDRRRETAKMKEDALRIAQLISIQEEQLIEEGRHLLLSLAELPAIRSRNTDVCCRLFGNLLKRHPRYANLGAVDQNGNIFCSAIPLSRPINIGNFPGIKRTIQTREFTVGRYNIGRITEKPIFSLNYPILDESGHVQVVIFATIDLAWLNQFTAQIRIPPSSTITLIDSNGIILVRYPNPEKWIGKCMEELIPIKTDLSQQSGGAFEVADVDGALRLYTFTPLHETLEGNAYLVIGIPTKVLFAEIHRIITRNLIWLGLVAVLALVIAWVGGDLLILRRVMALIGAAERLGGGELSTRSGLTYGRGEIGQLACTFDKMAEALEKKETERERIEERVNQERERAQEYLDIAEVMLVAIGDKGEITLINRKGNKILGYEQKELLGKNWFDTCLPFQVRESVRAMFNELMGGMIEVGEYYENPILTKTGEEKIIAWHNTVLKDYNGKFICTLSSGEDITERKLSEETIRIYQEQLRSLASELSLIEERERRRIATDLHDHIGQALAIAKIKLAGLQELASSSDFASSLKEIRQLIDQTVQYTRSLTFELSPPILYELGFEAAMEWLTEQIQDRNDIPVNYEDDRQPKPMKEEIRIFLFKAVKELMINIVNHAKASQAKVSIRREDNNIQITVEDDGIGFSPPWDKQLRKIPGYGLFSIRERLKYLGGLMDIESKPGQGTRVTLVAPLEIKENNAGTET